MPIPYYPEFTPVALELKGDLHPHLSLTQDGVSEFTFANLYLFRHRYHYTVAMGPEESFIISGERDGKKFFMTPCASPGREILESLFSDHDYWKNIPESVIKTERENLERWGIQTGEDRDNFDYLYLRDDLAELEGKKYHKKRNLVNAFNNAYPNHGIRPLRGDLIPDAFTVLEGWKRDKGKDGDYAAAREALELYGILNLKGSVFYVDEKPAGWCLGESIAKGRSFAVHFEKALDEYKGIYQYMNQAFAASLPRFFTWINREQDLGDPGLRQAKETYRPCGYVKKYTGIKQ
ncbi:MAG: DUF2156 domain-containing protein [Treponema sp.]|nr:DUF2156 domain-containing protein [Treponema sp.]